MRRPSVTARSRRPPHRTTGGTGTRRTWTLARAGALRTRPPTPPGATWRTSSTSLPPPIDAQQWSLHSRPRALARGLGTLHSTAVRPPRTDVPPASAQRRLRVVVDAGHGELAAVPADVDGDAGLGWQLRPAPGHDVVLERAGAAVVGDGAVLQRDAAAVGEEGRV